VQKRALEGVDTVYHLAAAHLTVGAGDDEFWRVNVEGVRSLVESAERAGVRRFVHCSSVGVYGKIENPPANEDSPCHPDIAYEKTKLAGEKVVLEAVAERNFPAVIIRPAWVYGPGCGRTEKLFRSIGKGTFFLAGRADALRHCVYIRDMVRAFQLASTSEDALGQLIIVGDAGAVEVRRLIAEIVNLTGGRQLLSIPLPVLWVAGVLAEIAFGLLQKEPPLSRRTLKFFTANTAFDIGRARRLLNYQPRYDLAAGLAETHAILRAATPWRVPLPRAAANG
jgi:nucleoside-diphosphate-sugar epimerase